MRAIVILTCAVLASVLIRPSTSRSETEAPSAPPDSSAPVDEPISGQAVAPAPGDETGPRDPFTPYDVGGQEAIWPYGDLTANEKAVVDHGRNQAGMDAINNAYGQAAKELAARAKAEAAAAQLGAEGLDTLGVP